MIIRRTYVFFKAAAPFILSFCAIISCHQKNPLSDGRNSSEKVITARTFLDLQKLETEFEIARTFFRQSSSI